VEAVARRVRDGSQFMLPTDEATDVAELLAARYGQPKWQFTLSASQANVEALRIARAVTGRSKVLLFDGKYHGHFDDALVELRAGQLEAEEPGLPPGLAERTKIVQFNDIDAVRHALEPGDVAAVLTEPALTNVVGLLQPDVGFHEDLRQAATDTRTLLVLDETHTQVYGPGGLTKAWQLHPDIITLGKSIAAGIPLGAYGMTNDVAAVLEGPLASFDGHPPVATGGTLFGNPVSMAAARATLAHVLTDAAYAHARRLGSRLANGLQAAIERTRLPWSVHRLGPRSGVHYAPQLPRNAIDAYQARDVRLAHTIALYLANRGVWDALVGAGPTCSIAATTADVDIYIGAFASFVEELTT
jgi:glutamate-1-semialdehyde aminotransferase